MKRGYLLVIALLTLAGILSVTAPLPADQLEEGLSAIAAGDYATALRLLRPLADQGNAEAQANIGSMYRRGLGVPRDHAEAAGWFRKAADRGIAAAQHSLGHMYRKGEGVPQDYVEAAKWYRLAAEQNFAWAQFYLGVLYANGQGVKRNYVQAFLWLNLVAAACSDENLREKAIAARETVAAKMTPEQIAEAQTLSPEWDPPVK